MLPLITGYVEGLNGPFLDRQKAEIEGNNFARKVGHDTIESLRTVSGEELLKHSQTYHDDYSYPYLVTLVDGWVLPESVAHTFKRGAQLKVTIIAGYNADEGSLLYLMAKFPTPSNWQRGAPADMDSFRVFMSRHYGDDTNALIALYKMNDPSIRAQSEIDMFGDDHQGVHMYFLCEHMNKTGVPAYLYFFNRVPPSPKQTAGAYHFAEVPFVFGTHDFFFKASEADKILEEKIQNYWVNFTGTGDPNGEGLVEWPIYSRDNDTWLNLNHVIKAERVSRGVNLIFLKKRS